MEDLRRDRGLTVDTLFQGADPSDTRFQFEIIKGLAESIRQLTTGVAEMQKTQVNMLERLARVEANRVGEVVTEVKADVVALDLKVDALLKDKDRRDGAVGMLGVIKAWAPFLAMLFSAAVCLVVYGRIVGVVPAAPVQPARVEATIHPEDRKIEGIVGGKP